jgi:SHS2 domain-containing protein
MASSNFLPLAGFEEVDHTADWSYRVWGENIAALFVQAAIALYTLAEIELSPSPQIVREIQLQGVDYESLLVAWLNELLYLRESENLGFDRFEILHLDPHTFKVRMSGSPVRSWTKFIKAATYNDLSICPTETGVTTTIVLDV